MKVVIVGAGIGGLACAIACRREGLDVTVLERTAVIAPVGAGIQIPPNAVRVNRRLGSLPRLIERSVVLDGIEYRRFSDAKMLHRVDGGADLVQKFGEAWLVIHRADYHDVLWKLAGEVGVNLRLGAEVENINFQNTTVILVGGEVVPADIVVGADGLWSKTRDVLLGKLSLPIETGDLVYRGTLSLDQIRGLQDTNVDELINKGIVTCWLGPDRHAVFYPVKGGEQFNLVLTRDDNLPEGTRQAPGDIDEMRACFDGWDPRLTKIISCMTSVLKWKLCHHQELEFWTRGRVALLGDACHPTLPYQAQGAAMAVEDGAVLGKLLGSLHSSGLRGSSIRKRMPEVLKLYEFLRKSRTTVNVQGAVANRKWYHLPDGPLQDARDAGLLCGTGMAGHEVITFAHQGYQHAMLAFDAVGEAERAFEEWLKPIKEKGQI